MKKSHELRPTLNDGGMKKWQRQEKEWARNKRKLGGDELKLSHNSYYQTIKNRKRLSWQKFLQRDEQQNHCWTAIKYTKPLLLKTVPVLKNSEENIATSIKAKKP